MSTDTVCCVSQSTASGTQKAKVQDKAYSLQLVNEFFPKDYDWKDDTKMENMIETLWTSNNDVDNASGRVKKKPQAYQPDGGEASTQDLMEIDKEVESELSFFGNKKPKSSKVDDSFDGDDLLPGQGSLNPENDPSVLFVKVDTTSATAVRKLKKNYDLARAQLNSNYDPRSNKVQKMTDARSDSFFKRFKQLEKTFAAATDKEESAKKAYAEAKINIGKFGSKLRILFKAFVNRNTEKRSIDTNSYLKDDDYMTMKKLFPNETRPKEGHIANLVEQMHNEVTAFYMATTKICESLGSMMQLNEKCQTMASLETTEDETVYYNLPDPTKFTFLPLASETLSHLQGLVATEVCDRNDLAEWRAKSEFYNILQRHIKAYEDFMNNMDDNDEADEYEDRKGAGAKRKRKKKEPMCPTGTIDIDFDDEGDLYQGQE